MKISTLLSLTLVFVLLSLDIRAHSDFHRWMVGSTFTYKDGGNRVLVNYDLYDIDLNIGYRASKAFVIGLRPEYLYKESPSLPTFIRKQKSYGIGIFGRHYWSIMPKFKFLLDVNIAYKYLEYWDFAFSEKKKNTFSYYVNYGLALTYFFGDHLAVEGLWVINVKDAEKYGPFHDVYDTDLRLGVQYFF